MQTLLAGIHRFQDSVYRSRPEFFQRLATGQSPEVLFITCCDSRIDPALLTQTEPGTLFIVRNIGNIVPPYSPVTRDCSAAAAIEYALTMLKVRDIIVCGHSHCGAMQALLQPESVAEYPTISSWLANADSTRRILRDNYSDIEADKRVNVCVQENVLVQLENLRTHPAVAAAISRGEVALHGWVYKIETGQVFAYDANIEQYAAINGDERAAVGATLASANGRAVVAI